MRKIFFTACCFFFLLMAGAQSPDIKNIRTYREQQENRWFEQLMSFLSIPNIASVPEDIRINASHIMEMMTTRSIQNVKLLHASDKNLPPAVYGEVITPGATQTIIFYAHYDGQPVDSTKWAKGLHPFKPVLLDGPLKANTRVISYHAQTKLNPEWRIFGRGSSDDKAGVTAILMAYEAIKATGLKPTFNIKFFFEGEEESGSAHLNEILQQNASLLQSDCWIICDGPVHQSGRKTVFFGARGDAGLSVTVYGSKRPLHSGHYGNWAPNPALQLSRLLASMKDDNGKVLVKGFYDKVVPLSLAEKKALNEIPFVDAMMKAELGFIVPEMKGRSLAESIMLPSLSINGMQSAGTGKLAANVIPSKATADLDLRLVKGTDGMDQISLVMDHIRKQGFYITASDPTDEERNKYQKIAKVTFKKGYNAQRTSMDLPIAKKLIQALRTSTSDQLVLLPTMGGSLPLFLFETILLANTITVPIANYDNNQHAENENLRLQNWWNGIETMAALMLMK